MSFTVDSILRSKNEEAADGSIIFGCGASEGSGDPLTEGMRSSTIWTVATDVKKNVIYYHTQHNRRVRMIDVGAIDFGSLSPGIKVIPLDQKKVQDIDDITPRK